MGREISIEEINEIMKKHDKSNDGIIQFEEFKQMLLEDTFTEEQPKHDYHQSTERFILTKTKSIRMKKALGLVQRV